ncbi:hypothetical protein DUI70_3809 [Streptomyces albus]|nr:hypothetical protein DUI70_3809 [Streptomyces albus]
MTASVQAWVAGKDWVCRSDINVEVACNWQYDKLALTARKVGGVWKCYDSEQLS